MIPTYDMKDLTGGLDIMFQNLTKIGFIIAIILITIWNIISLLIWLFGAKNKSEKAIKFGIKNFLISIVSIIIILIVPILFKNFIYN